MRVYFLCAEYLGLLSQYFITNNLANTSRLVPPFLKRLSEISLSSVRRLRDTQVLGPEPLKIKEQSNELHGDFACLVEPNEEFLVLPHLLPISLSLQVYNQEGKPSTNIEFTSLKIKLEDVKILCKKQSEDVDLVRKEQIQARQTILDQQRELIKMKEEEKIELDKRDGKLNMMQFL